MLALRKRPVVTANSGARISSLKCRTCHSSENGSTTPTQGEANGKYLKVY